MRVIKQGQWFSNGFTATLVLFLCLGELGGKVRGSEPDPGVPGVVIAHYPASSGIYVGSPSLAVLPDGTYIASHDGFGPQHEFGRTYLFASEDGGASWYSIGNVDEQSTSTLFVHRGKLYLMGLGKRAIVLQRSDDGGRSWTEPHDDQSGLILSGHRFTTAPTPIVECDGRLWRALEVAEPPGRWARDFHAFTMCAPVDVDLLRADNWTTSNRIAPESSWLDGSFVGWLEGNAVGCPDDKVVNVLRVNYSAWDGSKAAIIRLSRDGRTATFDAEKDLIDFPGGAKKFTIRFDPHSNRFWSLTTPLLRRHHKDGSDYQGGNPESTRNTLALVSSADLKQWDVRAIVLYHPEVTVHGFQYADWQIDGDDIVAVSRTAYDDGQGGAHTMHDANYLTFHRIREFRTSPETPPQYEELLKEVMGAVSADE